MHILTTRPPKRGGKTKAKKENNLYSQGNNYIVQNKCGDLQMLLEIWIIDGIFIIMENRVEQSKKIYIIWEERTKRGAQI